MKIINVMASTVDGFVAAYSGQTDAERHEQGFRPKPTGSDLRSA